MKSVYHLCVYPMSVGPMDKGRCLMLGRRVFGSVVNKVPRSA